MKILFFGDIVGKHGRNAICEVLPLIKQEYKVDLVIANGENAAGGVGLTVETAQDLLRGGVDVITGGNHTFAHKEIESLLAEKTSPVIRPLNYPDGVVGQGFVVKNGIAVVNLLGRIFIGGALDCPFRAIDKFLSQTPKLPKAIIVDFHAEATSEKKSLGYYLDGRVSAVFGTHTHVPTADEQILPQGTAYISDVGMCGSIYSVIGDEPQDVIDRFITGIHNRLPVAKDRHQQLNGVLLEIDERSGKAVSLQRVMREIYL
jgi:metallophosphoesterase (TIGR00282 family)